MHERPSLHTILVALQIEAGAHGDTDTVTDCETVLNRSKGWKEAHTRLLHSWPHLANEPL